MEPITHTDPPADGYRIHEADYYLRDPGFEPDELAALHLAASAVRLDSAHGIEGLWKLGRGARAAGGAPAPNPGRAARRPQPRPLFNAVAERRPATCATTTATVSRSLPARLPAGPLVPRRPRPRQGEERNFRVDRIEASSPSARPVVRAPRDPGRGGPAQPWQFGGDAVTAHLLVDRDQAGWVRGHLGDEAVVEERADGSVVFRVEVTNGPAFRSFVLSFLEHAEICRRPSCAARSSSGWWRS